MILEVLRVKGSRFTSVASQLHTWSRNEDHEDTLTRLIGLRWVWARLGYLIIWRWCKRFHTIWINQNGTSFTNIPTDQKLAEILEGKWLNGLSHNLVEGVYMDRRRPRKIYSYNEASKIYLLHKLKFWTETKIWSCAHMEALHELNFGEGLWFDDMKDQWKVQLIWICLACTSFTKFLSGEKLWKIIIKWLLGKWGCILACGNDMDKTRFKMSLRSIGQRKIALASECAI